MHVFQRKNEVKIPKFSGLRPDPDVEKQGGGIFAKGGIFARNPTDTVPTHLPGSTQVSVSHFYLRF